MKILIVFHLRLGDIVRMFPVAYYYAAQGYEVFIECQPQYWSIFRSISYAKPAPPGASRHQKWTAVFVPQVWPDRYNDFRASGKTWMDYVYGLYPEWAGIDRRIVFDQLKQFSLAKLMEDYQLPAGYQLIFPFCYSSKPTPIQRIFELAAEAADMDAERTLLFMAREQRQFLIDHGFEAAQLRCVENLGALPALIAGADIVLTVNTSTTIIAGAVRDADSAKARYFHVIEPNTQDDWVSPNQTRLTP